MQKDTNPIISEDLDTILSAKLPWDFFRDKTVLVTGGGGFLAAYLIKSLLSISRIHGLNIRVICLARSKASVESRLAAQLGSPDFLFWQHDISQPLPANLPLADFIIHAASQASPKYYGVDPVGTLLANSVGTMHALEHAVKSQSERFLFFSSGEVYGIPAKSEKSLNEQDYGYLDPMNVRSCYAESKRLGETMCVAWARQHLLHTNVVRPFHTYGPGMALNDGRVFADFVADAVAGRDIIVRSNGLAQRAFCYIADATIAFLAVLLQGENAEAYNIGNPDTEISIADLAKKISTLFPEKKLNLIFQESEKSTKYLKSPVTRSCPCIEKIKKLNWQPTTGLDDGFRRTILSFLV